MSTEIVAVVHGKHHSFEVKKRPGVIADATYYVQRDDGKTSGSFNSRAEALRWAQDQAGPDSHVT